MKHINWLDHMANLFVVILGISIAFYLEGYKEETKNNKQERNYLESLIDDLNTDIQSIDTLLVVNKRIMKSLVNLSNASVGYGRLNDSSLVSCMFTVQYNPSFSPQRTTYESLKSAGKMDLIDNFELRSTVVGLYEQSYHGIDEFDISLNEHIRDFLKPFYMKNVRFKSQYAMSDDFLSDNEFRNIIFGYRYLFLAKDNYYQQVRDRINEVKSQLAEEFQSL
ncbi:MAG: DUF6090 family protein [Bacteroidota bacterium]